MKIKFALSLFSLLMASFCNAQINSSTVREEFSMDKNWKFHFGNAADYTKDFNFGLTALYAKAGVANGCIAPEFNDTGWTSVDVPHDWAVYLPFKNIDDRNVESHGFKTIGVHYPETSIGWYRKKFFVSNDLQNKRFFIRFEGVYRSSRVWLNGHFLGSNESGYSEFSFDVTDYIRYNRPNVLVLRVDATQSEGWFYEGAGIYRHVWLDAVNDLHIPLNGVFVKPQLVSNNSWTVDAQTLIVNQHFSPQHGTIINYISDENKKTIASSQVVDFAIPSFNQTTSIDQSISISNPKLWSVDSPHVYHLVSIVRQNGTIVDSVSVLFGFRTITIDVNKGLFLNGKPIKVKGVCNHQDHAGVGVALPDALQYYRVKKLKEMGCNAIRTSHNPPTPALLQACDELGMLVLDETRLMGSSTEYLQQFENLILRDRNHPCVMMWSIGNEEWKIENDTTGKKIASTMIAMQHRLDPSRTSTCATDNSANYFGINEVIPVRGFNYRIASADTYRVQHPAQPIWGSEVASTVCTRGIYKNDTARGYVIDHDITYPWWATTSEKWWTYAAAREWFMGGFVWTGFDYRGEPTPYGWPCINSHFGIMDMCGFPKNNFYYYQSWWTNQDVLQISPHWNWKGKEGDTINVWCNSNADEVQLKLNGKSLGKKTMPHNGHLEWNVAYQPGTLEATAWKNGKVLHTKVETTGAPFQIILSPDKTSINADGDDVCVMNISVVDNKGREVADADNLLHFELEGNGKIIGVGNGDPSSHEPDKCAELQWQRKLFSGKCQVIIQSTEQTGEINFTANSDGLKSASAKITTLKSSIPNRVLETNANAIK